MIGEQPLIMVKDDQSVLQLAFSACSLFNREVEYKKLNSPLTMSTSCASLKSG